MIAAPEMARLVSFFGEIGDIHSRWEETLLINSFYLRFSQKVPPSGVEVDHKETDLSYECKIDD